MDPRKLGTLTVSPIGMGCIRTPQKRPQTGRKP